MRLPGSALAIACLLVAGIVLPARSSAARAEEAILPGGQRLPGNLQLDPGGRLQFQEKGSATPLPVSACDQVVFPEARVASLRAGLLHRILLRDGQSLTGELRGFDDKVLELRTAWCAKLSLQRPAVVGITHVPGFVTVVDEDFERPLKNWELIGSPGLSTEQHTSGGQSLLLTTPGQAASHALAVPLDAGRLGINFLEVGTVRGARWFVEAEFRGKNGPQVVRVLVAGNDKEYRVELPPGDKEPRRLTAAAGWHRLVLEFTTTSLVVTVDDGTLHYNRQRGPGGPLQRLRLLCVAGEETHSGAVAFDELSLAQSLDDLAHPAGDPGQDEVCLLAGDQVFGKLTRASRGGIELRGPFGSHTWSWAEVRGLYPRRQTPALHVSDGEHVRVWLRPGGTKHDDEIEGVVRSLDKDRLVLVHAFLGEMAIPRDRLHRLRSVFVGQRIELDNGWRHLGDRDRLVPALYPQRAEGLTLSRAFRLESAPDSARLVVDVSGLKGRRDGIADSLARGGLRTEVVLNGRVVDYLNRHVERGGAGPRRLRVSLPSEALRAGENVLELRQTAEEGTGRHENCGVAGLVIEVPRAIP